MTLTPADGQRLLRRYEAPAPDTDLFFIGSADRRITFYSQQVRALELIHALALAERFVAHERIAVIGGGAAGLTVAAALRILGRRVDLFDPAPGFLRRQQNSLRMLDPRIYEWPDPGALGLSAHLPLFDWSRGTAAETQTRLLAEHQRLDQLMMPDTLLTHTQRQITAAHRQAGEWRLTLDDGTPRVCTKVIVACGFGEEPVVGASPPHDYWADAGAPVPPSGAARCLVSGVGDGGLTDLMALLVVGFEHRAFTEDFLSLARPGAFADAVLRAEAEGEATHDLRAAYETHVRPVLVERNVPDQLAGRLKPDRRIVLNAAGGHFLVPGAASKLNQLIAFALTLAAEHRDPSSFGLASGKLTDVADEPAGGQRAVGPVMADGSPAGVFDLIVVRHGPDRDAHLNWLAGRFNAFKAHRDVLAATDPVSLDPPRLLDETYNFFHVAQDRFHTELEKAERRNVRDERSRLIVLEADVATGRVIERGARRLADVLLNDVADAHVHLIGPPAGFDATAPVLVRALHAVSPRVSVSTDAVGHAGWKALGLDRPVRPNALPVPSMPQLAQDAQALAELVDQILLERLSAALQDRLATDVCDELGSVHVSIRTAIAPVWTTWRTTLQADPAVRADVLRLLCSVEDGAGPWDGSPGGLDGLVAALMLMLGSSLAVPGLTPDSTPRLANMAFGGGLGLGSGGKTRGGKKIDRCNTPDQWDTELLVLSSAVQLDFGLAGSLQDAGDPKLKSLTHAANVAPMLIKNSTEWQDRLAGPLEAWVAAVEAEVAAFHDRQDKGLETL